jgi:hypothetical protein
METFIGMSESYEASHAALKHLAMCQLALEIFGSDNFLAN